MLRIGSISKKDFSWHNGFCLGTLLDYNFEMDCSWYVAADGTERLLLPELVYVKLIVFSGLRERDKREKSEEKIDCHYK